MNTRMYCSVEDVENYLLITVEEYFKPQVEKWIRAVSRQMDTMANRKLVVEEIGSGQDYPEMFYNGSGGRTLMIDDAHDIQSVEVDGTEIAVDAYTGLPKSGPFYKLTGSWPYGEENIRVVANFGYFDDVPDDIRLACTTIVAGIVNDQQDATAKSESIGNYSVTYDSAAGFDDLANAKAVIESYRRISF